MDKPLLSICIPTYNRADYLRQCLEAIAGQDGFDGRVEVVISDNCSTDDTQTVGEEFQNLYNNIHYFRNETNVKDQNFALAFQRAEGSLRKLTNDTVIYNPGAVSFMLNAIEKNINDKPQLFFLNSGKWEISEKTVTSLEDYVGSLGYNLTWIASLAIWEEDIEDIEILFENAHTRLGQVPFLINDFEKHKKAVIYDSKIMKSIPPDKKDLSYGLYKVFYTNFLGFIKKLLDEKRISEECFKRVKKDLLFDFFYGWIIEWENKSENFIFSDEKLRSLLEKEYRHEPYYRKYRKQFIKYKIKRSIKKIIKRGSE